MMRFFIPLIAVVLFYLEPVFGAFSPLDLNETLYFMVPRFLIMYLIFVSIYYDKKRAILYGLLFGLLYDVYYIDIIGLYSVLYPLMCLAAGAAVKHVHQNLVVSTTLSLILVALLELILYVFFSIISLKTMEFTVFLTTRLLPTMIANSIFLIMLGWAFRNLIRSRYLEKEKQIG
jgi:rod shape-determining protein MreD